VVVGSIAVAVIALAAIAVPRLLDDDDASVGRDERSKDAAAVAGMILAYTNDQRIILLGADGAETREIAKAEATAAPAIPYDVSPDARYAYIEEGFGSGGFADCGTGGRVARLNLATGRTRTIAPGHGPALSPDGRLLAYAGCGPDEDRLVVRDLASGKKRTWELQTALIDRLSWAPDARNLAFRRAADPSGVIVVDTDDDRGGPTTGDSPVVRIADDLSWHGYLESTGEFLAVVQRNKPQAGNPMRVVVLDPATGAVRRQLFDIAVGCCGEVVSSDADGDVLVANPFFGGELYRWRDGDVQAVKLTENIRAASWVDGRASG
jgi:Tol biopolymer transport system component